MGKKIIGNTIIFVVMIGLIIGFSIIFGFENTLIGVTTFTAVLMFLQKDFSLSPLSTAIKLICFNILMGVITFLASQNVILGIPLNFIFLFIMGYTLSYNLSTPSFVPFNLQYVFMLCTPITIGQLPKRLIALIVGALIIVLSQVLFNKNKIYKQGNTVLVDICSNIANKIRLIEERQAIDELEQQIEQAIQKFRRFVYNKREQEFYLTNEGRIKLNISLELEKINDAINELALQQDAVHILNRQGFKEDFLKEIDIVRLCLQKDENLNKLDELFSNLFEKYKVEEHISVFQVKILNALLVIKQSLYELKALDKKDYNVVRKIEDIPYNYQLKNIYKASFRTNSLRFSYALRLALGITLTAFVVGFFKIEEGKWIIYTVNSLIQPFYEKFKEKTKDRLIATVIGVVIITIVFSIIQGSTARTLAIMIIGYILSYNNSYRYRTINATVSAIGAAALYGNSVVLTIDRLVFVTIGAIISIVLSRFVFPYKAEDAKRDLIKLYEHTIASQINILKELISKKKIANEAMKNEILRANMIEDQLIANESGEENKNLHEYLEGQRSIMMGIADLYDWIEGKEGNVDFKLEEKAKIDGLVADKESITYDEVQKLLNHLGNKNSLASKMAMIDYIEIAIQMNRVEHIKASIMENMQEVEA